MEITLQQRVGRLLAGHRRRAGLTQAELAQRAEISTHMVAKLESGAASPSFNSLERLANALQVDVAELFTHELPGRPHQRKALTALVAELSGLSDEELRWVRDLVKTARKGRA